MKATKTRIENVYDLLYEQMLGLSSLNLETKEDIEKAKSKVGIAAQITETAKTVIDLAKVEESHLKNTMDWERMRPNMSAQAVMPKNVLFEKQSIMLE